MQNIFVINSGSSSLKFQMLDMTDERVITDGVFERIGHETADFTIKYNGNKKAERVAISSHEEAVDYLMEAMIDLKIINSLGEIKGVGHRVAHGGEFTDSQKINEAVIQAIEDMSRFAPLHNPVNLIGIHAFAQQLEGVPQVAVFDTSFHQTLAAENYIYAVPYEYYEEHGIRKYGFHGTSHQYISENVRAELGEEASQKLIICHLGNGASISAIQDGKSVNTSMGFTPVAGLIMGTRSGDLDPAVITYLQALDNLTPEEAENLLYNKSGLLGISGVSNDLRDIEQAANDGHQRAQLALKMFVNRVAETVASYIVELGGLDGIIFTAGVGENSRTIRKAILDKLSVFGIDISEQLNQVNARWIESDTSKAKVGIIATNEEIMIARDVMRLM